MHELWSVSVSPDGSKLAFVSNEKDQATLLHALDTKTTSSWFFGAAKDLRFGPGLVPRFNKAFAERACELGQMDDEYPPPGSQNP